MNTYKITVELQIEVESFEESDAIEMAEDALGAGDYGSYEVTKFIVRNIQEA